MARARHGLLWTAELAFRDVVALRQAVAECEAGRGDRAKDVIRKDAGCEAGASVHRALLKVAGFVAT